MSANNVKLVSDGMRDAKAAVEQAADELAKRINDQRTRSLDGIHKVSLVVDDWEKANAELDDLTRQLTNG